MSSLAGMDLETRSVDDLLADPRNARRHPPRNIDAIRWSLRKYGQQKNVVITPDGALIAGSGTLLAARAEGMTTLACKVWTGTVEEARSFGLLDNRTSELADWDEEVLADDLQALPRELIPEEAWSDEEIASLLPVDDPKPQGGPAPEVGFDVIVECASEAQQRLLIEQLTSEGFEARPLPRR
jgi:ParB-like chromosome segregation protein Spo0J